MTAACRPARRFPNRSREAASSSEAGLSSRVVAGWRTPASLVSRVWATRILPPRVAAFQVVALVHAWLRRDGAAFLGSLRAPSLALLLRLSEGRRNVVELGTATA